jgi:lauroyl/myristoyl acyltransferase
MQREGIVIPLPLGGEPAARVEGLYRLRRFLRDRGMVFMAADGPLGSPLFTLDVPGPPPVVRGGWFHLRRQLRAPTFPTLMHESSGRRIVTVHPALPDVEDDPERDAAACRDAMSAIVREYVRRWPAQCRYLAFPPWASNANPGG